MNELAHKRKGYKGISDQERMRLIREAVKIVASRFSYGVAVTVNIHEFKANTPGWIRGFKDAYPFLCHMAMTALVKVSNAHDDVSPITYVFEAGHAYEPEARDFVRQASLSPEMREMYRYNGDTFLPKTEAVPLQAADLLAWETAKFKVETLDRSERAIRLSLAALWKAAPKRYQVAFCGGQPLMKALGKYRALGIQQLQEEEELKKQRAVSRNTKTL